MARSTRAYDAYDVIEPSVGNARARDTEDEPDRERPPRAFWFAFDEWRVAPREEHTFVLA
jgi:hypothetical protein